MTPLQKALAGTPLRQHSGNAKHTHCFSSNFHARSIIRPEQTRIAKRLWLSFASATLCPAIDTHRYPEQMSLVSGVSVQIPIDTHRYPQISGYLLGYGRYRYPIDIRQTSDRYPLDTRYLRDYRYPNIAYTKRELITLTGRAPELCGWALCPGLVLLLSFSWLCP